MNNNGTLTVPAHINLTAVILYRHYDTDRGFNMLTQFSQNVQHSILSMASLSEYNSPSDMTMTQHL